MASRKDGETASLAGRRAGLSHGVPVDRSWRSHFTITALDGTVILRIGLAVLFLANAVVAWVNPEEFTSLIGRAGVDRLVDAEIILWGIRANDAAVALAVLFAWDRWPRVVQAWVGLYVLGVGVIKLVAIA